MPNQISIAITNLVRLATIPGSTTTTPGHDGLAKHPQGDAASLVPTVMELAPSAQRNVALWQLLFLLDFRHLGCCCHRAIT